MNLYLQVGLLLANFLSLLQSDKLGYRWHQAFDKRLFDWILNYWLISGIYFQIHSGSILEGLSYTNPVAVSPIGSPGRLFFAVSVINEHENGQTLVSV